MKLWRIYRWGQQTIPQHQQETVMSKNSGSKSGAIGGKTGAVGGKTGTAVVPNLPSTTGNPSGGGRGNAPPSKK